MPRDLESGALELVDGALGAKAPATLTRPTTWDDENLQQVLDVSSLVSRGTGQDLSAGTEGLFGLSFVNLNGSGDNVRNAALDPWLGSDDFPAAGVLGPIPTARQFRDLDIWLLFAQCWRSVPQTSSDIGYAMLQPAWGTPEVPRFGINSSGTAQQNPVGSSSLAIWTSLVDSTKSLSAGAGYQIALTPAGESLARLGVRLPRGRGLIFSSAVEGAAGSQNFTCFVMCRALPRGMRPDDAL